MLENGGIHSVTAIQEHDFSFLKNVVTMRYKMLNNFKAVDICHEIAICIIKVENQDLNHKRNNIIISNTLMK